MKNKTLSIIVLALGLTSAGISVTQAQSHMKHNNGGSMHGGMTHDGMMHGGMMHGGMMYSQLNLTEAQQQQIESILTNAMEAKSGGQSMMTNMQAHMAESQSLINSATFDESKAREMITKHQASMVDVKLNMLKARHQVFQVLTEPQKEQFNTLMSQRSAKMQQYMSGKPQ
ncbi:MAG: Spy/CpxP family protein refolding chaperone [Moritella sp.]|uniref:Spy/CpxP family protein refolding chaperone n=1 Tax=Moritella sp. TaxID=78556 RepID=UPI0029B92B9A|nr:Spy/CpxP family protein refolding chaperone [Moritella sp.]MDX2319733.1 Spy/CpxP family protein refolding chaperone [Moritella sp.]